MSRNNENTDTVLEDLRRLTEGLLYLSETDAPLEVVRFSASSGSVPMAAEVATWTGKEGECAVETVELGTFSRFQALQAYLEQHLREVRVYRIGHRRITALVVGKASSGEWVGVKTELVET